MEDSEDGKGEFSSPPGDVVARRGMLGVEGGEGEVGTGVDKSVGNGGKCSTSVRRKGLDKNSSRDTAIVRVTERLSRLTRDGCTVAAVWPV